MKVTCESAARIRTAAKRRGAFMDPVTLTRRYGVSVTGQGGARHQQLAPPHQPLRELPLLERVDVHRVTLGQAEREDAVAGERLLVHERAAVEDVEVPGLPERGRQLLARPVVGFGSAVAQERDEIRD